MAHFRCPSCSPTPSSWRCVQFLCHQEEEILQDAGQNWGQVCPCLKSLQREVHQYKLCCVLQLLWWAPDLWQWEGALSLWPRYRVCHHNTMLLHISWPGHTCPASSVDRHLQVCNSRPPDIQPGYLVHGVNMGPLPSRCCRLIINYPESSIFNFSNIEMMNVSTISDDKLMDIIKLVKETYNKFLKVVFREAFILKKHFLIGIRQ